MYPHNESMRKLLLLLTAYIVISLSNPQQVFAGIRVDIGSALEALSQIDINAQMAGGEIQSGLNAGTLCQLVTPPTPTGKYSCQTALGITSEQSAVGMVNNGIVTLYKYQPADTGAYIADVAGNIGIVTPAYAQTIGGIGFSGLAPLLPIWKSLRNIAYALLIIVMVIIGFMIMFRRKIDPRTVVTVQNALPRIILTLILITFSYAIAGLMIDFMYLAIGLAYVALGAYDYTGAFTSISNDSFPHIATQMLGLGISALDDIYYLVGGTISGIVNAPSGLLEGSGIVATIIGGALSGVSALPLIGIGIGATLLPAIIVALIILFAMLRVFFMLLTAYMQVLISVLFAPLQIMLGALPGNGSFGNWLRGLIANLSVFAVTAILIALAIKIGATAVGPQAQDQQLWTPPGISGHAGKSFAGLIGLGIMLVIPSIVAAMKEALKAKPIAPIGPSIFLGPITSGIGAVQQGVSFMGSLRLLNPKR